MCWTTEAIQYQLSAPSCEGTSMGGHDLCLFVIPLLKRSLSAFSALQHTIMIVGAASTDIPRCVDLRSVCRIFP